MLTGAEKGSAVAVRAKRWYTEQIAGVVERPENRGKIVAIDARTGEYEMDGDLLPAVDRLKARLPHAEMFAMRVGYPTAVRFGAGAFQK